MRRRRLLSSAKGMHSLAAKELISEITRQPHFLQLTRLLATDSFSLVFLVEWDHLVGHLCLHVLSIPPGPSLNCHAHDFTCLATTTMCLKQCHFLCDAFRAYVTKHFTGRLQRLVTPQDAVFHKERSSRANLYATTVTRTMRIVTAFGVRCRRTAKMRLMSWLPMFWAASPTSLSSSLGQPKL
jgi:hypothetical protein